MPTLLAPVVAELTALLASALFDVYTVLPDKFNPFDQLLDQLPEPLKIRALACSPYLTTPTLTFPEELFATVKTPSINALAASFVISANVLPP